MNKPEVILIAAISIDGFIAPLNKETLPSTVWTSKEDKQFFTEKSKEIGTLVMGSKTFETFKRPLPDRKLIILTKDPSRYAAFNDDNLLFTADNQQKILDDLAKNNVKQVAVCGGAHIYNSFMKAGLVDRMFLTVEPFIFGDGIKLFAEQNEKQFKLVSQRKLNETGTTVLEYQLISNI